MRNGQVNILANHVYNFTAITIAIANRQTPQLWEHTRQVSPQTTINYINPFPSSINQNKRYICAPAALCATSTTTESRICPYIWMVEEDEDWRMIMHRISRISLARSLRWWSKEKKIQIADRPPRPHAVKSVVHFQGPFHSTRFDFIRHCENDRAVRMKKT